MNAPARPAGAARRWIVYFHYDRLGRVDASCLFMLRALAACAARLLFVTNGSLNPADCAALAALGWQVRERENTGFDVGAYREVLLAERAELTEHCGELILMNYTLAGPVRPLGELFSAMEARPELDFWGLTRHYAMNSRRFRTRYGYVPEHIQSHFLAVRPRLLQSEAFWRYWQEMPLPQSYEQSVALHEANFTPHFAALGFRWDTYVQTADLAACFVNPIMACPRELIAERGCPAFKRRSFFTDYADELRRTAGDSALELYDYLRAATDYPVDTLVRDLLQTQPLTELENNLHWQRVLGPGSGAAPLQLAAGQGGTWPGGELVCLFGPEPPVPAAADAWYAARARRAFLSEALQAGSADLFAAEPLLGVLSPAVPNSQSAWHAHEQAWAHERAAVEELAKQRGLRVPIGLSAPAAPGGSCVILRRAAFGGVLPPLNTPADWWLLPLIAQENGYCSMTAVPAAGAAAAETQLRLAYRRENSEKELLRMLARAVKRRAAKK